MLLVATMILSIGSLSASSTGAGVGSLMTDVTFNSEVVISVLASYEYGSYSTRIGDQSAKEDERARRCKCE